MNIITGKVTTKKELDLMIKMKREGFNTVQISKVVGKHQTTVERNLKKVGFKNFGNKINFTKKDREVIKHLYLDERMNSIEVWEHSFKKRCNPKAIELLVKDMGISRGQGRGMHNKYIDHDYFKEIDNPNKAYLLGNISADASVSSGKTVRFEVSHRDIEILEFAKKQLNVNTDIHRYSRTTAERVREDTVVLNASSVDLVRDLKSYNVVKNKQSLNLGIPKNIPSEYLRDYIRGYFDGDGSIFRLKRGSYGVSICCDEKMAYELEDILIDKKIIEEHTCNVIDMRKYGINIFHVRIGSIKNISKFAKFILRDGYFSLERKRKILTEVVNKQANIEITH